MYLIHISMNININIFAIFLQHYTATLLYKWKSRRTRNINCDGGGGTTFHPFDLHVRAHVPHTATYRYNIQEYT